MQSGRVRNVFIRALGLIYFSAFLSFGWQALGLIGSHGLLPAADYLNYLREHLGWRGFYWAPSLFWLTPSDSMLTLMAWIGGAAGVSMALGFLPGLCAAVAWVLYLSLINIGNVFYGYQWESLLLEAGFIAVISTPWRLTLRNLPDEGSTIRLASILYRFLLFRLLFSSGLVKLLSGDVTWRSLSAMSYHYQTQPLPTWVAWYAAQLPSSVQKASTLLVFVAELGAPLLFLTGGRSAQLGFILTVSFQLFILLTGNYTYFNFLAIALALFLLDDTFPWKRPVILQARKRDWVRMTAGSMLGIAGLLQILAIFRLTPPGLGPYRDWLERARLVSGYGLFAVMTTTRNEIEIEGSDDGKTWKAYVLPWKPGPVDRKPAFVAPYQPRLDWQLWFASLSRFEDEPWLSHLAGSLLVGDKNVLALFSYNPFPSRPPASIRMLLYEYRFTSRAERQLSGAWWQRKLISKFSPTVALEGK